MSQVGVATFAINGTTETVGQHKPPEGNGATSSGQPNGNIHQHDKTELVQQTIDGLNQKLLEKNQTIVFDYDTKTNRIWLNVVDNTTGKVVEEMPPHIIRQIIDSLGSIAGLVIDTHS